MSRTLPASISTWIAPLLRTFLQSFQRSESLACGQCGRVIDVARTDGISSFKLGIEFSQANRLHSKFYLEATGDGRILISCACSPSVVTELVGSGGKDGISSIVENSSRPCGCDPGANHVCDWHRMQDDLEPNKR